MPSIPTWCGITIHVRTDATESVTSIRHLIRTAAHHGLVLDEGPTAGQPAFSARVAVGHAQQLWERAVRELGPALPLEVASAPGDHIGLMYFAAASCRTIGEALQLVLRHWRYVTGGLALHATRRGDAVHVQLQLQVAGPLPLGGRLAVEYLLAALARAGNELSGGRSRPTELVLGHCPPTGLDAWEAALGVPVRVATAGPALVIAGDSLAQPVCAGLSRAAGQLFLELLDWCTPQTQLEPTVAQRVAEALRRDLCAAAPTVEQVAVELALSPRSLHRQLAAEGTSYQRLLDGLRCEEAIRQALDQGRSFKAIAAAVGFADPRAFRRAFKRWTGTTPQQFRQRGLAAAR
jgi:AraC-like DNA-binding protein